MIAPRDDGDWEIMKFAAKGMYTGTGAGSACLKACIDYAREQGIKLSLIHIFFKKYLTNKSNWFIL